MRVGIITILDDNYGNRLQNYAVQEVLRTMGHDATTIKNSVFYNGKKSFFAIFAWLIACKLRIKKVSVKKKKDNPNRMHNFKEFNKKIKFNRIIYCGHYKYNTFDYYIAGSDQIWNPYYSRLSEIDVLSFAKPEKRISFAASFGISEIPDEKKQKVEDEISKFKAISVREEAGKRIIEEITGRTDVQVLIDPTMLLSAEDWDRVAKRPKMLHTDKFILNYFLGDISEDKLAEINALAKELDCEVINILDKNSPFYECGPSEFVYLEKQASLICTDSFHSSVFAVLYNRPFIIYERPAKTGMSMYSRIDTLLTKLQLSGRKYNGEQITHENLFHDYTQAYKLLELERKKSYEFLKNALLPR